MEETIQVWLDTTEHLYIVSRGVDGVDAPDTIATYRSYKAAMARAERVSERTGLRIIDEC